MAYVVNITGTTQVDDSVIQAYDQAFLLAVGQDNVMDQFVQYRADIGAKSIEITKYPRLAVATTPLTEDEEAGRTALSDTKVVFTPAEYGLVVTRTQLASLQSGGKVDIAMATVVGENMGHTKNVLATRALEASTNVLRAASRATDADVTAGDVLTKTELGKLYNKLARSNVAQLAGGYFGLSAHDDVIHDLREAAAAGDWIDIAKYQNSVEVLRNEVGIYKGFRIIRNNDSLIVADAGAAAVDVYATSAFGARSLGLAESLTPTIVFSGPFDALQRFANVGWKGAFQYGILDTDSVWQLRSASSVGVNA